MSKKQNTTPLTPEEMAERAKERKNNRNARIARHRTGKNFLIWLLGWIMGVIFIPLAIVVTMMAIPVGTLTGNNTEILSEELNKKSLFNVVVTVASDYKSYGFADFPIVANSIDSAIKDNGLDKYVKFDPDKLNEIKFTKESINSLTSGEDVVETLKSFGVEVVATLDNLGVVEMMSDFGRISVIKEESSAGTLAELTTGSGAERTLIEGKNPKEYYYKESGEYIRAFDNDGKIVPELSMKADDYEIIFPPLKDVKVLDLVDIVDEAFSRVTISSILDVFGARNETLVAIIGEDTTIGEVGTFDVNTVKLSAVIEINETTQKLFDVIVGATTATTAEEVNIGHLLAFDVNEIKLTSVIANNASTADLYNVLISATGVDSADEITIDKLSTLSVDDIELVSVLPRNAANKKIWDVIDDAITLEAGEKLTVSKLSTFDVEKVKLETVLPRTTANQKIWDVLDDAIVLGDGEVLTINKLATFDVSNVKLETVLPRTAANQKIWDVLDDAIVLGAEEELTISKLSTFDVANIELETVFPRTTDSAKLWSILDQAIPLEPEEALTINKLSTFDVDNIEIDTVITSAGGNKVLGAILGKGVKLGELGTAINDMEISEIFDTECFTTDAEKAIDTTNKYVYDEENGVYELDNEHGTYYISGSAKTWLFTLYTYNPDDIDADTGVAGSYTEKSSTFGNIATTFGSDVSGAVMNATVKQLIQAGVIAEETPNQYSKLYKYTVKGAFDLLAEYLTLVP